jgi:hypothetical protein
MQRNCRQNNKGSERENGPHLKSTTCIKRTNHLRRSGYEGRAGITGCSTVLIKG